MSITTHRAHAKGRAATLVELAVALAVGFVVVLIGWASVEMTQRETLATMTRVETSRNTQGVMGAIETNVMRAREIRVPDPDYGTADSMELIVASPSGDVRRAYRLDGDRLIIDFKDEQDAPHASWEGVQSLAFDVLDPPTNSLVEITCTVEMGGDPIQMRTVAKRRN
jgi:hypothetical protein